jgi:hypothetical protein
MNQTNFYLIYGESIAIVKECNFAKRHNSKKKQPIYKKCVGALRREKVMTFKGGLCHKTLSSENSLMECSFELRARYRVAHFWLQKVELFLMGRS